MSALHFIGFTDTKEEALEQLEAEAAVGAVAVAADKNRP